MATKPKAAAAVEAAPAPKSKKKLIIIIALLIVLLAGGGAAAFMFLKHPAETAEAEEKHEPKKTKKKKKAAEKQTFIALDSLTANLKASETAENRFIQLGISIALGNPKTEEELKERAPKIRNTILMIVTQKTAEELLTIGGKEALSKEILEGIRSAIPEDDQDEVQEVLFTAFIVQ